jgi:transposase-like protein
MVNNAIRSKKLFSQPCEMCGKEDNIHAHHDDYDKPLNVRWLCPICHKDWHIKNGEGKNAK